MYNDSTYYNYFIVKTFYRRVMEFYLRGFLNNNIILMLEKFDFRTYCFIHHQLVCVVEFFNAKRLVATIFLDVTKTFDNVMHEGIL